MHPQRDPNTTPFCLCGCGEKTPIAIRTDRRAGIVKGQPGRFIRGHQRRLRQPREGYKTCSKCGFDFPESEMGQISVNTGYCFPCKRKHYKQRWTEDEELRRRAKASRLRRYFGLTVENYEEMTRRQDGRCAICGQPEKRVRQGKPMTLAVDHDALTGEVRGLLCVDCNRGLGIFNHDPKLLEAAARYMRRKRTP